MVGDRYIIDVVPATMAEVVGEKKVNLQTNIYVNNDAAAVKTHAAGDNIPEYAAKYVDANNIIHPAAILLTDPYGYDKDGWVLFKYPFDPFYRNFARRYFRSLIRNFSLREKIGCISEKSK